MSHIEFHENLYEKGRKEEAKPNLTDGRKIKVKLGTRGGIISGHMRPFLQRACLHNNLFFITRIRKSNLLRFGC